MADTATVLVVDDDAQICDMLRDYLDGHGYKVLIAGDGAGARSLIAEQIPHVVLLDVGLPGEDGLSLARHLRENYDIGIIMVSGAGDTVDRIIGLEVGADDYLAKPFSPRELVARLKALLRRPRSNPVGAGSPIPAAPAGAAPDGLEVDEGRRLVRVDGEAIELTALEFNLLAALAREPGIVVTRARLLDQVWGIGFIADDHLVDVHVANVRRKLKDDPATPRFIETVRGVGYRVREAAGPG